MSKIPIGIIGISGYTGLELIKLVTNHPIFEIAYLANTTGNTTLHQIHKSLVSATKDIEIQNINLNSIKKCKLVFLALPHEESMKITPKILDCDIKVIDLSADYRLSAINFNKTYTKHIDIENLKNAQYGLIEWNRDNIKNANLVANPGCYPTASLLGILPFTQYIDGSIFIDAKSGVSGAGKKPNENTHYPNINDNIFSYQPLNHRHQIEISEKCNYFSNKNLKINFVPHLSPFTRGMLVSIFAKLNSKINPIEVLKEKYKNEEFIRIRETPVDIKSVCGTHFCDIFAKANDDDLYINTSIDNLLKGASSQALACANLALGIDETTALPKVAYVP